MHRWPRTTRTPLRLVAVLVAAIGGGLAGVLLLASSVYAWGHEGHEIVAILAEQRLASDVREKVHSLLNGTSVVDASMWADHIRNEHTAPWHYVNIELDEQEYNAARDCPNDQCVIGQIERFRQVLADDTADEEKRHKALKYLLHFVADLHQPLHVGDHHDRGGNDVQVEFLGQSINPYNQKPWNLHAVWDSGILEAHDDDARHAAERLNAWLNTQPAGTFQDGSVVDWAMESHRIAKEHVYAFPENRKLGEEYYNASRPLVDQQLAKAGVRLAKVLNEVLSQKTFR